MCQAWVKKPPSACSPASVAACASCTRTSTRFRAWPSVAPRPCLPSLRSTVMRPSSPMNWRPSRSMCRWRLRWMSWSAANRTVMRCLSCIRRWNSRAGSTRCSATPSAPVRKSLSRRPRKLSKRSMKPSSIRPALTSGWKSCATRRCSPSIPRPLAWMRNRHSWLACRSQCRPMRPLMCR
ncbi:hypothetical protein D9M73_188570 [compost metagenome]